MALRYTYFQKPRLGPASAEMLLFLYACEGADVPAVAHERDIISSRPLPVRPCMAVPMVRA